jgi:DNA-binding MarR family transcriptional regulator
VTIAQAAASENSIMTRAPSSNSASPNQNGGSGVKFRQSLNTSLRFGFLIHDVSRLRRVVVDRALKPLGITRSQWWVLAFLSRRDGMTQTALAADLDLTKVAIGGLLDRMETAGFVERRADQSDGRARRVYLTRAGANMVNAIRASVETVELEILNRIPEEALAQAVENAAHPEGNAT